MKTVKLFMIGILFNFNVATSQTLDASFGTNGLVVTELTEGVDVIFSTILQQDNKIIACGQSNGYLAITRYNTDGSLDNSFGNGGILVTTIGTGSFAAFYGGISDIKLQQDGKIILIGNHNGNQMTLMRYTTNGVVDTSFGNNGKTIIIG